MIRIDGTQKYKVNYIQARKTKRSEYTFIIIQDELRDSKEKAQITVWGEDLSEAIEKNSYIVINSAISVGVGTTADKNNPSFKFHNLRIFCDKGSVRPTVVDPAQIKQNGTQEQEPDVGELLPF